MADIRVRLIIEGRVQGVWFRDSTRRQAVALGVTGWARNRPEGNLEVLAEGPEVDDLVAHWQVLTEGQRIECTQG